MPLTISIALCTYNGERFLQEQLDSFTNQTQLPDEVVVGDDGSTDGTLKILENWAKTVPFPVRIQRNAENLGYAKNFEQTMLRCVGDVIFLSDQDDVWKPEKLEKMVKVFETRPDVGLVYCNADTMDQDGNDLKIIRSKTSLAHLLHDNAVFYSPFILKHSNPPGCCSAIRQNILRMVFPFKEGYPIGHDVYIYRLVPALTEVVTLRQPLIWYRFHGGNTSIKGNWQKKYQRLYRDARRHYRRCAGFYFLQGNKIQHFLEWIQSVPDSPYKRRLLRYVQGNQVHYPNRVRIQGNFFLFFPLFFWEILTLRYFERIQPFKSMAYDVGMGIWNGRNPVKTFRQAIEITRKIARKMKLGDRSGK